MRKKTTALLLCALLLLSAVIAAVPAEAYAATTPAQVKSLTATVNSSSKVTLKWKKVSGASGYVIYRKLISAPSGTDANSGATPKASSVTSETRYTKIAVITSGKTVTYKSTGLTAGATYRYYVKAYTGSGANRVYGKASKTVTATTED